jgi:crotonobetainyl-CoA:carnitine CoA-transferase CaiB-like acyl-CoA transferase
MGEHTRVVLRDLLRYSDEQVDDLMESGCIK